ncbi:glycosyltransferase [Granulosicoccus sp.]|nr:glycosyltransferase [Granulosicoccus sp.]MDB4223190.1 glycosyltransferase [Granulosicoccus sp.]
MTSRIPRILHVTHEMAFGGTQQVISQLVTNLDCERFICEIACIDGEVGALGERLQSNGTNFHVFHRGSGFDFALVMAVRKLLIDGKYDIVHCHQYTPYVYGIFASAFTGVKVVFTEHGRFYPDRYSWKRRLVNPVLGKLTDSIVAISVATRSALAYYEWFSEKQIKVIYNGLIPFSASDDLGYWREQFGVPEGVLVFGTIARFDPIKNIPMMINGFKQVYDRNPKTRLLLVGDGTERPMLQNLACKAGIEDVVIFTGFQRDTAKLMSLIDVYLLSSFSEGTSMTLLEAMSSGTCSIVTGVGGNVELIEHEISGVIVDSEDTSALASSMEDLAANSDKRRTLGNEASKVFNTHFSIGSMIDAYSRTYEKVLGFS